MRKRQPEGWSAGLGHGEILAAIERRDPYEARDAMRRHVLRAGELIARWVEQR